MEATLYKSRIEIMRLEACNVMERIRNAGEGLAMTYDLYMLLIRAEEASLRSQEELYQREEEGVLMDPKFIMDFVRKELDFVDNLKLQMDAEIREAELQMENESRLRQYVGERCIELQEQLSKQDDVIKCAVESLEILKKSVRGLIKELVEQKQAVREEEEDYDGKNRKDPSPSDENDCNEPQWELVEEDDVIGALESGEPEANLQEDTLDEVDEHAAGTNIREDTVDGGASYESSWKESIEASDAYSRRGSSETNVSQTIYPGAQRRKEIEARITEIKIQIHHGKEIPERKLCHANFMREQERYMRSAFLAKGMHYSDCCPTVPSVEVRMNKIRCRFCLDT
ncbi:hypothetical protein RB195_020244 [Necator americanus]|uniref:Uncharacterized protein n=2 Tax=Necator americanus TaxID=51031 RepID=W2SLP5_NECAM|nr:hypothetical protein NECAME_14692 [Necator americanus]ETN70545.1 hypothetical protein NECAME_14692 [Necator americanus]